MSVKVNAAQQAASEVNNMAKNAAKDTVVTAKIVKKAASGDYAGAIATAVLNPMTVLRILATVLALVFVSVVFTGTFIVALPCSVINSVTSAATDGYDALVLGWEEWKATLGNQVDDFFTWLTTGESGTEVEAFRTDVAVAQDPDFSSYVGTTNSLVAVLNNYFRDAYNKLKDKSYNAAKSVADERQSEQEAAGIQARHISRDIQWIANDMDYVDWTFYVISCDSVSNLGAEDVNFRAAPMIAAAKDLLSAKNLWNIEINSSVTEGTVTEQEYQLQMVDVQRWFAVIDEETGEQALDENGEPLYELKTVQELQWVLVPVVYPTRHITVQYKAVPKTDAKNYIINYYGITDEKADEDDVSDLALVEENVLELRRLYSNAIGELVASGSIKTMIQNFYTQHPDWVFAGPGTVGGPMENWRSRITSHMGATDIPEHASGHGGTDISAANYTPCLLTSQATVVAVTNIYPNVNDYSYGGGRGNFVLLYYGEQNGITPGEQKGIFVLYQHLATANVAPGDVLYPGVTDLIQSGTSGKSTGPHWHIEAYVGLNKLDPEYFLL